MWQQWELSVSMAEKSQKISRSWCILLLHPNKRHDALMTSVYKKGRHSIRKCHFTLSIINEFGRTYDSFGGMISEPKDSHPTVLLERYVDLFGKCCVMFTKQ